MGYFTHSTFSRADGARSLWSSATVFRTVAALVTAFAVLVTAAVMSPVLAAPLADASMRVTATKTYDGTGHGSSAASWITSDRGFEVADDSADDGVVSSHDLVGYSLDLQMEAGPKRWIEIRFISDEFLSAPSVPWTYALEAGQVRTVTRSLTATAQDTHGQVVSDQAVSAEVWVSHGQGGYQLAETIRFEPVSVVSAPFGDLVLAGGGSAVANTRTLTIRPLALRPAGQSSFKGISTGGDWQVDLDVSQAPDGSRWDRPVVDDVIRINGSGGQAVTVTWNGPSGFSGEFDVHYVVAPGSLSVEGGLPNNGTGMQPGDGLGRDETTAGVLPGAAAGSQYPNNDWTKIAVEHQTIPTGDIFRPTYHAPFDRGHSIFVTPNLQGPIAYGMNRPAVTPGTEGVVGLEATVGASVTQFFPVSEAGLAMGFSIDPAREVFHHTEHVRAPRLGGIELDSAQYRLEWSGSVRTAGDIMDPASTGWTLGAPPGEARSARIVVKAGTFVHSGRTLAGYFGVKVHDQQTLVANGVVTQSPYRHNMSAAVLHGESPLLSMPSYEISRTLRFDDTARSQLSVYPNVGRSVEPGVPWTMSANIMVNGIETVDQFEPVVQVTLDRCLADPQLARSLGWSHTITPAVPGPSGTVCGDALSQPAVIEFRRQAPWVAGQELFRLDHASMSTVTTVSIPQISATISDLASAQNVRAQVVLTWEHQAPVLQPLTQWTASTAVGQLRDSQALLLNKNKVDIGQDLQWDLRVVSTGTPTANGELSTVIILPHLHDEQWGQGIDNLDLYQGPMFSQFDTPPTLTGAWPVSEHSQPGTTVFFTTNPNPTFDPDTSTWHRVDQAGEGEIPALSSATALQLVSPQNQNAATIYRLRVTMDAPDDTQVGDTWVLWTGPTSVSGSADIRRPWPGGVEVVETVIEGRVWWDYDGDGSAQSNEPAIAGAKIGIYLMDDLGTDPTDAVSVVTTSDDGTYRVVVPSGNYWVKPIPGGPLSPTTDLWGTVHEPELTASNRFDQAVQAQPVAVDQVSVAVEAGQTVTADYGYKPGAPAAQLDVTPIEADCLDVEAGQDCSASWQVQVVNTGTTPLQGQVKINYTHLGAESLTSAQGLGVGRWQHIAASMDTLYAVDTNQVLHAVGKVNAQDTFDLQPLPAAVGHKWAKVHPLGLGATSITIGQDSNGLAWYIDASSDQITPVSGPDGHQLSVSQVHASTYSDLWFIIDKDGAVWSRYAQPGYSPFLGRPNGHLEVFAPVVTADSVQIKAVDLSLGVMSIRAITPHGDILTWGPPTPALSRNLDFSRPVDPQMLPAIAHGTEGFGFTAIASVQGQGPSDSDERFVALDSDGRVWLLGEMSHDDGPLLFAATPRQVNDNDGAPLHATALHELTTTPGTNLALTSAGSAMTIKNTGNKVEATPAFAGVNDATALLTGRELVFLDSAGRGSWVRTPTVGAFTPTSDTRLITDVLSPMLFNNQDIPTPISQYAVSHNHAAYIDQAGLLHFMGRSHTAGGYFNTRLISRASVDKTQQRQALEPHIRTDDTHHHLAFTLPAIAPGEAIVLDLRAELTAPQASEGQTVNFLTQAWWTSEDQPISLLLPQGLTSPQLPQDPGTQLHVLGIGGNPTCSADPDQALTGEDLCDQVGVRLAAGPAAPPLPEPPLPPAPPVDEAQPVLPPPGPTAPPTQVPNATPDSPLAQTGSNTLLMWIIAVWLFGVGAITLVIRRLSRART